MSTLRGNLRSTTAIAALLVTFSASVALGQAATVDTELGVGETIVTNATYGVGTPQKNSGTLTATATGNSVSTSLTVDDTNNDIVTMVVPQADNLISAAASGNISTGAVVFAFAPSSAGDTAAVGTLQSVEANITASSSMDTHSIVIENTDIGVRTFTGSALQDNNDITAGATGNDGTSSITVASGLDVLEPSVAGQASVSIDGSLAAIPDSDTSADLLVSSSQEIDGAEAGVSLAITSTVSTARTTVLVEDLSGASVTITESDQASSATGNTATNTIESLDTAANITAAAAIANLQSIVPFETASISATTDGSTVSATAGDDSDTLPNGGGGVANSTVSLTDNAQSAAAAGSTSTQTLTLDANSITGNGPAAVISDSNADPLSGVQLSANGDAVIGNVQSVETGVTVSASTTDNTIVSSMAPTDLAAVSSSSLKLDGNTQSSSAIGVSTTNALSLTSGATLSAPGAVASVQSMDGAVTASTTGNSIDNLVGNEALSDSLILTANNSVEAIATGASASNTLETTTATNNLSVASNAGSVTSTPTGTEQPGVTAGQALTNDQDQSGSVTATATDNQIQSSVVGAFEDSTVTTDGNNLSASATANAADNEISLAFNNLTGTISGSGTGVVAATANEQTLGNNMTVTARNVGTGGIPVLANANSIEDSNVSTSGNTVSANASGNVTDGNDVLVDERNVASGSQAAPSVMTGGSLTATGSFISASTQISGADVLASQLDNSVSPPLSNTIETQSDNSITGSSVVSDSNVLSASATANRANNAVQLGSGDAVAVAASGVVANYQGTAVDSSVSAEIGVLGSDPVLSSGSVIPGVLNGAGVIVRIDVDPAPDSTSQISASTISVSDNTVVGVVNGNVANNAASATANTVTGLQDNATEIAAGDTTVAPANADLATATLQENASTLSSGVAGTFAIIDNDGDIGLIANSTQTVSDNLQQSYATANNATNGVDLTANNTNADTALESLQSSTATVSATSDLDVVANAGATNSTLAMEGNRNESVANGNVATNTTTLDATNATATLVGGAPPPPVGVNASIDTGTLTGTANNALASVQSVTADITASATTDVYNQDATRTAGNEIITSSVSLSSNATIAQTTGNNGTQALTLGDAGTANMGRTGVLINNQSVTASAVSSTADQDVFVALTNTATVPVQSSSLLLDGNSTTALARSNLASNTLNVDGGNIVAGNVGTNANFAQAAPSSLDGAYVLGSVQDNGASVTATTSQARVAIDMSHAVGDVIDSSTLSLSGNASAATALANSVNNSVSVGANAAMVDASAALGNTQNNTGAVGAIGGLAVQVDADAIGGLEPNGINGSSVILSDNSSVSNASGNQAQNTLTASGANISSGATVIASLNAVAPGAVTANAGNLLLSDQANTGAITSTNTANFVTIDSDTADGVGSAANGSTLSASGNTTEALATANLVLNSSISIGGASTASTGATGLIGNFQFNDGSGSVTASASTTTRVTLNGAGAAGALSNSSATVQDNSTLALARGNVSQNMLSAEGANVNAGATPATINATSPDAGVLNASYGVFNEQVQQAAVSASSLNATYALNATSGTGAALNAATAAVGGNSINASAFGNVATNSVALTSLSGSGNIASAAVFNGQINSGAIMSSVTGASIGTFSIGGIVSASAGVSGNSISASSVGNFASSTVTRVTR